MHYYLMYLDYLLCIYIYIYLVGRSKKVIFTNQEFGEGYEVKWQARSMFRWNSVSWFIMNQLDVTHVMFSISAEKWAVS